MAAMSMSSLPTMAMSSGCGVRLRGNGVHGAEGEGVVGGDDPGGRVGLVEEADDALVAGFEGEDW